MMARISGYRGLSEIDEEAYFWFLEVLPPRIMTGSFFCFAEGMEPFRLFWKSDGQVLRQAARLDADSDRLPLGQDAGL